MKPSKAALMTAEGSRMKARSFTVELATFLDNSDSDASDDIPLSRLVDDKSDEDLDSDTGCLKRMLVSVCLRREIL